MPADSANLLPGAYIPYIWPVVFSIAIGFAFIFGTAASAEAGRNRFSGDVFPVEAVNWIEDHPSSAPVFNYFPWGGYLLFRSWPDQTVFIDGQTDFYGESLTRQYEKVITLSDGWQDVLAEYRVGRVLMPADSVLAEELIQADGWQLVYLDGTAAIVDSRQ
jgi:hypothetical protein